MDDTKVSDPETPATYAVGPVKIGGKWVLQCPVCDEHSDVGVDPNNVQCTKEWLAGRELAFEGRSCICWQSDPYEGEEVENNRRADASSIILLSLRSLSASGGASICLIV